MSSHTLCTLFFSSLNLKKGWFRFCARVVIIELQACHVKKTLQAFCRRVSFITDRSADLGVQVICKYKCLHGEKNILNNLILKAHLAHFYKIAAPLILAGCQKYCIRWPFFLLFWKDTWVMLLQQTQTHSTCLCLHSFIYAHIIYSKLAETKGTSGDTHTHTLMWENYLYKPV